MTDKDTAERRDEIVKRMLATPPKKHKPKAGTGEPAPDKVSGEKRPEGRE